MLIDQLRSLRRSALERMDTAEPRMLDYCAARVTAEEVELRSRLALFSRLATRNLRDLSQALGCRPSPN